MRTAHCLIKHHDTVTQFDRSRSGSNLNEVKNYLLSLAGREDTWGNVGWSVHASQLNYAR